MVPIPKENLYAIAARALMLAVAAAALFTFRDYGVSWDEEIQNQYGLAIFDYYISGFTDRRYGEIFNLYLYGGLFDGLAALVNAWSPVDLYQTRHLLNALFGLLGLWGTWRLGRLLGGGGTGLLAIALLATTPMYYGHMFNNPKDIPFAAGIVWTLYFMAKGLREFPRLRGKTVVKTGLLLGLTMGGRVGGVLLLAWWGITIALRTVVDFTHARRIAACGHKPQLSAEMAKAWLRPFWVTAAMSIIAYLAMLLCWPWAHENPITNPIDAFFRFSNFPQAVEVLLDGKIYMSTDLPWTYLPLYFAIQLPELHLALIGLGLLALPWSAVGRDKYALFLIMLTVSFPVLYAVFRHPALYDAARHFIFILPPLCVVAAIGVKRTAALLLSAGTGDPRRRKTAQAVAAIAALTAFLAAVQVVADMVRLHPYEYIYANRSSGGVKGIEGKYELDYWGSSFKEAAERLREYVDNEGGVPSGKLYRLAICGPWSSATIYLPPDYDAVEANREADFFLSTTRWGCQKMREGKEIIRIERDGALLSVVKDLRPPRR